MIGMPNPGDLVIIAQKEIVAVVTNRIDSKRGTRLTMVAGGDGYSSKIEVRPMRRMPDGWSWIPATQAHQLLAPAD